MSRPVILCVDDERFVLSSLKEQIRNRIEGYDIETADSGQEALEYLKELLEDKIEVPLIISDYIMLGMNGDELLKLIHTIAPQTVKILLTGQATIEGISNAINYANLYRYIAKPWEKEDLCMTITEAVRSYYKDRQLEAQNKTLEGINRELVQLTDAVVETMVTALDTRDTTTAGHSKRLAGYALKMAEAVNHVQTGKYKDFRFSEEQQKELYYAALLHDIGKIGVREQILLKQYRLSEERQNAITYRFNYYKKCLEIKKSIGKIGEKESCILSNIDSYLKEVIKVSRSNYCTPQDEHKIREIAKIEFEDVDDTAKKLLDDFEVENLTITRGNLTDKERKVINSHVEYTYNILKGIPWLKNLERVPDIASSHHERIDGTGYCKGLKDEEIPVQAKILALLDIFEALTAPDRPYKPPMSVENALKILQEETDSKHLDKDIFEIFINEQVYNLFKTEL